MENENLNNVEKLLQDILEQLKHIDYLLKCSTKLSLETWKAAGRPGWKASASAGDKTAAQ